MTDLRRELESYIATLRQRVAHSPSWVKAVLAPKYALGEAEAYGKVVDELQAILHKTEVLT